MCTAIFIKLLQLDTINYFVGYCDNNQQLILQTLVNMKLPTTILEQFHVQFLKRKYSMQILFVELQKLVCVLNINCRTQNISCVSFL